MVSYKQFNNGLRLVINKMEGLSSVSAGVLVKTGSINETKQENGISHFIEHNLFKGTQKRTAFEILAREVSFCGSKAETGTGNYNPAPVSAAAPAPSYQTAAPGDFEEITDDEDLPF